MRPQLFALAIAATLVGCKAAPLPESTLPTDQHTLGQPAPSAALGLGAGDLLHVTLLGHPELSTPLSGTRIDREGRLHLPLVGPLAIDGFSESAAEGAVEAAFAQYVKEPDVTLSVAEFAARRIYVFGEVDQPGALVLDRPLNAFQALALAGGFGEDADRENVCILRTRERFVEVLVFDAATPDVAGLTPLHPDDFLFVRQTGAGTFREQAMPYIQGFLPMLNSLINLGLVAEAIDD